MSVGSKIPWNAACIGCEYPLRGLGHPECPECGHKFDPADRRTYNRLGILTYTRKLYRGEFVVAVFLVLFLGFLALGIAGFYLL